MDKQKAAQDYMNSLLWGKDDKSPANLIQMQVKTLVINSFMAGLQSLPTEGRGVYSERDMDGLATYLLNMKRENKEFILKRISEGTKLNQLLSEHYSPSAPEQREEWVRVEDGLPDLTEPLIGYDDDNVTKIVLIENFEATVLGFDPEIGIFKAKRHKGGWSEIGKSYSNGTVKPTHWRPLPAPPNPNNKIK